MIERAPRAASGRAYDLIVIGGGIHGAMLTLESSRRGYRTLLLERADFGGATSWNSLRIVHGGLRYLQTLDLRRFRRSVSEQRWYLRHFPDLVRPLGCMMPLYRRGLRRPATLRAALLVNDLLRREGRGRPPSCYLPPGKLLSVDATVAGVPPVDRTDLLGAAVWHDAVVQDPARVLIETLRWACSAGATCLNYTEAVGLLTNRGSVEGVRARDRQSGSLLEFHAPAVANCAGPWISRVARDFGQPSPPFRSSLAFNLLLDRAPPSAHAVAVAPPTSGGRVYFLSGLRGRTLAGTYHAARPVDTWEARATPGEVREFLADLNRALPGMDWSESDVLRVMPGLLPAKHAGTARLATRDTLMDHAVKGGPTTLLSVCGIKYTTARRLAEDALSAVFGRNLRPVRPDARRPPSMPSLDFSALISLVERDANAALDLLRSIVREEAVVRTTDLLYRRMDWGLVPHEAEDVARLLKDWRLEEQIPPSSAAASPAS